MKQETWNRGNLIPEWGMQNSNTVNETRNMESRQHNSKMRNAKRRK